MLAAPPTCVCERVLYMPNVILRLNVSAAGTAKAPLALTMCTPSPLSLDLFLLHPNSPLTPATVSLPPTPPPPAPPHRLC